MNGERFGGYARSRTVAVAVAVAALALTAASAGGHAAAAARPAGHAPAAGTITTVAGGVGGPARATKVSVHACGMAYAGGHLYVADATDSGTGDEAASVRMVNPATGQLTTVAGTGLGGVLGDGGLATRAQESACSVATDKAGNLVLADGASNRIRVVAASTGHFYGRAMTSGHIYSVAGTGTAGFSGDGGPATAAKLSQPAAVAVDGAGNLVVADSGNNRIRVVAASTGIFYGKAMTTGDIYLVAGNGATKGARDDVLAIHSSVTAQGVAVDGVGNLVIADGGHQKVRVVAATTGTFYGQAMTAGDIYKIAGTGTHGFSGDGGPATAARLFDPDAVALDGAGNVLIADAENNRVRVVAAGTGTFYGQAMTAGDIYTVAGNGDGGSSGDGGPATSAAVGFPGAVTVDGTGNLLIANGGLRVVAARSGKFYGRAMTAGDIYTVAGNGQPSFSGDGGAATRAQFHEPFDTAVAGDGTLVVADTQNYRVRIVPAHSGTSYGRTVTAGHIYTIAGNGTSGFSGDGGPATAAELAYPNGVAVDGSGNVLICDLDNNRVRAVAASTGTFYGKAMSAGDIYTIAGNGTGGFSGDGGPATSAELQSPTYAAVDGAGNVVVNDAGNGRVRVIAASTGTFYGKAMTAGDIYTIAGNGKLGFSGDGGPATSAEFNEPAGVAVDGAGNLLIADFFNERIRVVAASTGTFYGQAMTAGDVYTVAGDGTSGFSGDGGPATAAELAEPAGVAVDAEGNLLIADTDNERIRVVATHTGTFYGQAMTAGDIYTIAGNGTPGFSGDGGPATSAEFYIAQSVAVDGSGNVIIDSVDGRIRKITG